MAQIDIAVLDAEIKRLQGVLIESQKTADNAAGAIQECVNLKNFLIIQEIKMPAPLDVAQEKK